MPWAAPAIRAKARVPGHPALGTPASGTGSGTSGTGDTGSGTGTGDTGSGTGTGTTGTGDTGSGTGTGTTGTTGGQPQVPGGVVQGAVCGVYTGVSVAPSGSANPWDTAEGQNCFERWIAEAESRLNAYDGDDEFNARKQWHFNQYGLVEGNPEYGPYSVAAPDNFGQLRQQQVLVHVGALYRRVGLGLVECQLAWRAGAPAARRMCGAVSKNRVAQCRWARPFAGTTFTIRSTVPGNDMMPPPVRRFPRAGARWARWPCRLASGGCHRVLW